MADKNNIHITSRAVIIDEGYILLCKTLDLSSNFYFLPGGHIEHGESAEEAVKREMIEEGGFQVSIKRFLGCLENSFEPGHSSFCHNHEYNLFFEAQSKHLNHTTLIPQREEHIEMQWLLLERIHEIDVRPEALKAILPLWLKASYHEAFQTSMK